MINRVLFYNSGGGIGDAIQILPLIVTLKHEFKNADFFYLCAHDNHFNESLKNLNCSIKTLNLKIKYFGFRWWHLINVKKKITLNGIKKFDLIIDLQSKIRNTLILKRITHEYFISPCVNFKLSKPSLNIKKSQNINKDILLALNSCLKTNFKMMSYDIKNIDNKFNEEARKLLPKNSYVGLSITQGNIYRKKEWPLNNIVELCNKLILKKKIPVFFIEKKNQKLKDKINQLIPNSLFPEHESNLSSPALVTCLGKRLDFAISIDNGIMHMLSLGKIPMVVLFGPTNSNKFAPDYKDLIILDSKKLKNTSDISAITPKDVLLSLEQHPNFSY
jgi:ADP-heptose:LPS heptosyltransferase